MLRRLFTLWIFIGLTGCNEQQPILAQSEVDVIQDECAKSFVKAIDKVDCYQERVLVIAAQRGRTLSPNDEYIFAKSRVIAEKVDAKTITKEEANLELLSHKMKLLREQAEVEAENERQFVRSVREANRLIYMQNTQDPRRSSQRCESWVTGTYIETNCY